MSQQPERKEKDCLNCGALVEGRFCHVCGQENIVPRQSFFSLITHFIYDIFHFDGKFFETVRYLVTRPGYVPREYVLGKRASYLDPIRMYLFTSAVFFLVFFAVGNVDVKESPFSEPVMNRMERYQYAGELNSRLAVNNSDTIAQKQLRYILDSNYRIVLVSQLTAPTDTSFRVRIYNEEKMLVAEKLSGRDSLNNFSELGWLNRIAQKRWQAYRARYGDDSRRFTTDLLNSLIHKFPYMLFISLPFFAGILMLLYKRHKRFFYSDHAVFTLYQYILTFILMLFFFLFQWLANYTGWGIFNTLGTLVFLSGGVYLFFAMRRFYEQRKLKTFLKFILLNFAALVVLGVLMIFFFFISVFQF